MYKEEIKKILKDYLDIKPSSPNHIVFIDYDIAAENISGQFEAVVIKKPAGVLPNIILGIQGIRKHRDWNNLLRKVYTYTGNHLKDFASSYRNRFEPSLHLYNQQNYRRLLNHHLLSNVSRQSKPCISFYKILNKLKNNINHIKPFKTTLRFERTPKGYSFFSFYVKQVFHKSPSVYYKYNKYNKQCQIIIL